MSARTYDDRVNPSWLLLPGINLTLLFVLAHEMQTHGATVAKLLSLLG